MKATSFLHCIVAAAMCVLPISDSAQGKVNIADVALTYSYAEQNAQLPPLKKGEKRVVFIGDSETWNWQNLRPEFFSNNGYLQRGICGQTTSGLLLRFRRDAIDNGATIVVLQIGTNDIAENNGPYDEDIAFSNIVTMCELAQHHGIKVVLGAVLPAAEYPWNLEVTDVADKIERLNRRLEAYAKGNNITWADYYSPLVHPGDRALPVTFSEDGVHPNASGYVIMESVIQKILKKM